LRLPLCARSHTSKPIADEQRALDLLGCAPDVARVVGLGSSEQKFDGVLPDLAALHAIRKF
jgi:hypothetical protein